MYSRNKKLNGYARSLRKNMTPEERHLWYDFLRDLPVNAKRQYIIGNYILDFYIPSKKTAIELDGRQHTDPDNKIDDANRDKFLFDQGITVLRYRNDDIRDRFITVAEDIKKKIGLKCDE